MKKRAALTGLMRGIADCGRMMVGVPSYESYQLHIQTQHPDAVPMSKEEFFRDRQAARFGEGGRGGFRCC